VDVQEERGKADTDSIAKRFFSSYEIELLGSIEDDNERRHMFFRIWAAKEAYIKMTGMGLREELSDFSVSLEEMIIRQGHPEETSGYIREPLPLTGNVLTVCFGEPIRKLYIEEIFF
jgi:4'-phosphopantetheinyl transferase